MEDRISLKVSAPWLSTPPALLLASNGRTFEIEVHAHASSDFLLGGHLSIGIPSVQRSACVSNRSASRDSAPAPSMSALCDCFVPK